MLTLPARRLFVLRSQSPGLADFHFRRPLQPLGRGRRLPKFASNNRAKGTAEENQAVVAGSIAHFGKYTVDEKDKYFTFHVETSTYPNWDGTTQKRAFTVSGDELKYTNPVASAGGGRVDLVFKRAK